MRERHTMTGFDMEQNSQSYFHHPEPHFVTNFPNPNIPPVNTVPNLEAHSLQEPYDNSSMFYAAPEYHFQRASPNFYPPHAAYAPPPSHGAFAGVTSTEHDRNAHFMDQGYKRKSAEVIPGYSQYPSNAAAPSSFPQLNTPETAPFSFPQYGTYPQPVDQRSVRNRAGAATMDPLVSHGHNNFLQGNYAAHPTPPPPSIWHDQRLDASPPLWSQAPYNYGNAVAEPMDSGNFCFPRYHETPRTRDPTPIVDLRHHYLSYQAVPPPPPPPPSTGYYHMASASYTVPEPMHNASYSHVGPVQATGLRIHHSHPRENFVPAPNLRYHGLRAIPADEGDFFDAYNNVDHHQDLRLDIDDMSYEELLDLSEQIGSVNTGLPEKDVGKQLKRRTCLVTRINLEETPCTDSETDSCSICQENYESQAKIATLDCRHAYHAECLKKWLVIKNICPICKSEALVMEKEKKKKKARLSIGEEFSADSW